MRGLTARHSPKPVSSSLAKGERFGHCRGCATCLRKGTSIIGREPTQYRICELRKQLGEPESILRAVTAVGGNVVSEHDCRWRIDKAWEERASGQALGKGVESTDT